VLHTVAVTPERSGLPSMRELMSDEEAGWTEIRDHVSSLAPAQVERPGYFPEGWSVKDLLGHLGSWLAEASVALTQLEWGTYRPAELDIEAKNDEFLDALRTLPLPEVKAQAESARSRMLHETASLPELTPEAVEWIEKGGPRHYSEHLPRLREWVRELRGEGQTG
jgi:hypothetical protein